MAVIDLDILTVRKRNLEVVVRLVETNPGDWRVYKWKYRQCKNWSVTVGRKWPNRFEALKFIQEKGYVVAETQSHRQSG